MPDDATGSIATPDAPLQVDIGEASSTELPLTEKELSPPVQGPESLRPLDQSRGAAPSAEPGADTPPVPDDKAAAVKPAEAPPADARPANTDPLNTTATATKTADGNATDDISASKMAIVPIPMPPVKIAEAPAVRKVAAAPRKHRRRARTKRSIPGQPAVTTRTAEPSNPFAALFGSPSPAASQPH
jgi:hypothetical protein